jgi:hypothetical protein
MGGGHATRRMEPQHYSMQNNKLYTFQANVRSRGSAARRGEASKLMNHDRDPACLSEAEEKNMLESDKLKAIANMQKYQEEGMERLECQNAGIQYRQLCTFTKPSHQEHRQVQGQMGWTICSSRKDKA